MEKQWVIWHRRRVFLILCGAVCCFLMGWYLQADWVKTTPEPQKPIVLEVTPPAKPAVQIEQKNLVSFRLDRDREQSRQRERLQELLLAAESGTEWAKRVESELLTLERRINFEHELENLLATRGYPEAAVSVNDGAITVVVDKKLEPEQVNLIGQWAADVTGYPIGQIRIIDKP